MDLSILQTVAQPEPITAADYTPPLDYSDPIKEDGDYKVRVIDGKFKDKEIGGEDPFRLGKTKSGYLSVEIALEVVDGKYKGKRLYDRVNQVPFPSNNKSNSFSNFLFGFGAQGPFTDPTSYVKALSQLIGKGSVAAVYVSREWYSNPNSTEYAGTGLRYKSKDGGAPGTIQEDGIRLKEENGTILLARNVMSKYRQ